MGFTLTKTEANVLGRRFAKMLLLHDDAKPVKIPILMNRKDWKDAESWEKKRAIADIAQQARAELLKCGYNKELVEKKTEKYLRN